MKTSTTRFPSLPGIPGKWALLLALALLPLHTALAASATWSATPTDGDWVTVPDGDNNWSTGVSTFPGSTTFGTINNADTATFANVSSTTAIAINSTWLNIKSISFGAASTALSAFTIGATNGNSLLLTSGGAISFLADTTPTGTTETINAPIVLEGNYSFTNSNADATNILSFGGKITNAAVATLTLNGANAGNNIISGIISNGGGAMSLTTAGTAKWILSGANTFNGGTTVAAGTILQLNNSLALQNSVVTISAANGLTFNTGLGSATMQGLSGSSNELLQDTASAAVTLNLGTQLNTTAQSYGGTLSGAGGINFSGRNSQTFTVANTYAGATSVTSAAGDVATFKSTLGASGSPFGTGAMTLTGATLSLAPGGGGVVAYSGPTATSGPVFTYAGGQSSLSLAKGSQTSVTYTVGNGGTASIGRSGNGLLVIKPSGLTTLASSEFFKVNGAYPTAGNGGLVNGIVNPSIVGLATTTANYFDFLTYDPTNGFKVATFSRNLTTAGSYTSNANELLASTPASGTVTLSQGGGNAYALEVGGAGTTTISGTLGIGDGIAGHQAGLILNSNVSVTAGGKIDFGAAEGIVYFRGGYNVTMGVPLAGTGGVTLGGDGGGPSHLNAGNTFSGGLTLTNGVKLSGDSDSAYGSLTNTITWNGGNTNGNLASLFFSTSRQFIMGPAGARFDADNSYFVFAGNIISGPGIVSIISNGSTNPVVLTGNSSYGGVRLNNGYLDIASDANLGGANSTIQFDGGTLAVMGNSLSTFGTHNVIFNSNVNLDIENPNNTFTIGMPLNQGGSGFTKSGPGTVLLTAANTYTGATTLNGGTIKVDASQGGSLSSSTATAPTFAGGTLWLLGNTTGTTSTKLGNVTINAGGGTLKVDANTGSGYNLTLGTLTAPTTPGGSLNILPVGSGVSVTTTTARDASGGGGIIGAGRVIYNGADWASTTSLATPYVLSGYSGYADYATDDAGNGSLNDNARIQGAFAGTNNTTVNSLKIEANGAGHSFAMTGTQLTLTNGGLLFTGTDAYTISGGTIRPGTTRLSTTNGQDLIIQQYGSGTLAISSTIANAANPADRTGSVLTSAKTVTGLSSTADLYVGMPVTGTGIAANSTIASIDSASQISLNNTPTTAGAPTISFVSVNALTVAGTGKVDLTGNSSGNTYTGATYVNSGATLSINAINQLGATVASNIYLNGGILQFSGLTATTTHPFIFGGSGGTFDLINNSVVTINASAPAISGGALTLNSSDGGTNPNSVLILNQGNSFVDGVNINGGTLRLGAANTLSGNKDKSPNSNTVAFGSAGKLQLNGQNTTIMGLSSASSSTAIVENGNSSGTAVTLTVNNGDNQTFAGTIQNGTTSDSTHGGLSIVKGGGGTWTLTGTNTFTGSVQLLNGTINLGSANALTSTMASTTANGVANNIVFGPIAAGTAITNGGVLQYTAASAAMDYSPRIITSAAPIAIDTNGQSVAFATALASTNIGGLTKSGSGTLTLSAANLYTGPTLINAGTLQLTSPGSLASGSPVTVNGGILNGAGTVNGTLTVNSGSVSSTGSIVGAVTVNGGSVGGSSTFGSTVNVNSGGTLGGTGVVTGAVTIASGGTLSPGDKDGVSHLTLNSTLSLAGTANFAITTPSNYNQIIGLTGITYGGILNITSIGTPSFAANQTYQLFPTGMAHSASFTTINEPDLTSLGLKWSAFDYGNGSVKVVSLVEPSTDVTYSLGLAAATLNAHMGATVGLTATITNNGGGSNPDSLTFTGLGATGTGTIGGPTAGGSGDVAYPAGNTASTTGLTYTNATAGSYTLTAAVGTVTPDHGTTTSLYGSAGTVTLNIYSGLSTWHTNGSGSWGTVAGTGTGAFGLNWGTNQGSPGLDASFNNTDTATFDNTVLASGNSAIVTLDGASPSLKTLTFNTTSGGYTIAQGTGGSLTMNGSGAGINVTGSGTIAVPIALASNTSITTHGGADTLAVSGIVSGTGTGSGSTLTVAGPGSVTLSNNNTYSGGTAINTGATLQIGTGGATGTLGGGDVADTGTLIFDRSDTTLVVANNITNAGGSGGIVTQSGSGMTTLSGTNSYSGGTHVNNGTLEFTLTTSQPTTGTVTVANGATLAVAAGGSGWNSANIDALLTSAAPTGAVFASGARLGLDVAGAGSFTYSSSITDTNSGANALALTKLGTGTLVLGGNNSFTGGLYLNGGTLSAADVTNLGASTGSITFNGGTLAGPANLVLAATRAITVGPLGGTITQPQYTNQGANPKGSITIASNLSGAGPLTVSCSAGYPSLKLSGNNSAFSGSILVTDSLPVVEWDGQNSSGTGTLAFNAAYTTDTLNLRSDTNTTFLASSVAGAANSTFVIDADHLTAGVTGKTVTLNAVGGNNGALNITGANGYTVGITTLNLTSGVPKLNPTSAKVAIGTITGTGAPLKWNGIFDLAGTATGNTIGVLSVGDSSGGGNAAVRVLSGGWTLTGAATYGSASAIPLVLLGGRLTADFNTATPPASILAASQTLIMGNGTLVLNGNSAAASAQSVNGTYIGGYGSGGDSFAYVSGGSSIVLNSNGAFDLRLNLGAINSRSIGSTLDITQPSGTLSTTNGVQTSKGSASSILLDDGIAFATVGGNDWAAKDATNAFIVGLSSLGGYTLSTSTSLAGNADVATSVNTTLASGATITSLRFNQNQATTIDLSGNTLVTGGILITPAVATAGSSITGGTLQGPTGQDLVVFQNSAQPFTIGSAISDNIGATGLTKSGSGTLLLTGNNTYTGATTVNHGILQLAKTASLPTGSAVTANSTGMLAINVGGSGEFTTGSSGAGTIGGVLAGVTWNVGSMFGIDTTNASGSQTYAAAVTNANVGLAKLGTGTLLLTAANTYGSAALANGGVTAVLGGTLQSGIADALPVTTNLTVGGTGTTFDLNGHAQTVASLSDGGHSGGVVTSTSGAPVFTVNQDSNTTFSGSVSGGLALTKALRGTLTLSGNSDYTGNTLVTSGTLVVNGSLASSSVNVSSGATLGGSGKLANATLSGAGQVGPGNSPGILIASQVNPTGGLGFNFEYTNAGAPTWNTPTGSRNDVLRLTNATTPFTASLTSSNAVNFYLDVSSLAPSTSYQGGFFTDLSSNFLTSVQNATQNYFVLGNGSGTHAYNGLNYYTLAEYNTIVSGSFNVTLGTFQVGSANFADGTITNGWVTDLTVVPEPATWALLAFSLTTVMVLRRRRS